MPLRASVMSFLTFLREESIPVYHTSRGKGRTSATLDPSDNDDDDNDDNDDDDSNNRLDGDEDGKSIVSDAQNLRAMYRERVFQKWRDRKANQNLTSPHPFP